METVKAFRRVVSGTTYECPKIGADSSPEWRYRARERPIKLAAMPLEGHYERQTTPLYKLSGRELKAAFAALAVTLIAVIAVVAFTVGDSNPAPAKGCISTEVAGKVGGEMINACGQEAVAVCSRAAKFTGARAGTIVADCEKQGIKF